MPYRIESSPNNRAGCSNKECKDQKIKITKGEIRVGTWVETEAYQSWNWRHWGCTTPLVLSHIVKGVFEKDKMTGHENYDLIDGWEDLPEVYQETIRNALIEGHVADDDWKGDPECNRPGMRGFRLAGKKKAAKEADANGEGEDAAANGKNVKPAKGVKKASSAKNKKPAGDEKTNEEENSAKADGDKADTENADDQKADQDEKPVKAKRSTRSKMTTTNKSAGNETTESSAMAKRTTRAKAAPKKDADAETQPAKRRGRSAKSAGAAEGSTKPAAKGTKRKAPVDDEQDEAAAKPKRGRKKAVPAKETGDQEAVLEKPKRGRKKVTKE